MQMYKLYGIFIIHLNYLLNYNDFILLCELFLGDHTSATYQVWLKNIRIKTCQIDNFQKIISKAYYHIAY